MRDDATDPDGYRLLGAAWDLAQRCVFVRARNHRTRRLLAVDSVPVSGRQGVLVGASRSRSNTRVVQRFRARSGGSTAVAVVMTGAAVVGAAPAEARTVKECAATWNSCIRVNADKTLVNCVEARNGMWQHPRFEGHFQVTGPGFSYDSPEISIGKYSTTRRFPVNRNLPDNSQVCSTTWKHVNGQIVFDGRSCLNVHR